MTVWRHPDEVPEGYGPSVVAIGKFDGVHSGHRAVIDRARVDAAATGARVVAVTFDRNPLAVLRPDSCPDALASTTQKVRLLADAGVDASLVLTFDEQLAALDPRDFVEHVLVDALGVRTVLVGQDFRFGRAGAGDPETLRALGTELGFDVHVVEDVCAVDGRRVSSTWVRNLLADGDVATAARLLGRPHAVRGEPAGAGAAPHARTRYPAAISIGTNPTFGDVLVRQVEAYVLDETDLDLYGHTVEIRFVERLRGMVAFSGIEPLMAQMADDVARTRATLLTRGT